MKDRKTITSMEELSSLVEKDYEKVLKIQVQGLEITELPEDIFHNFPNLEEVRIRHTSISSLPENLFCENNKEIYMVDFSHNKITNIPKDLFSTVGNWDIWFMVDYNPLQDIQPMQITENTTILGYHYPYLLTMHKHRGIKTASLYFQWLCDAYEYWNRQAESGMGAQAECGKVFSKILKDSYGDQVHNKSRVATVSFNDLKAACDS